jgi:hypothetical protein
MINPFLVRIILTLIVFIYLRINNCNLIYLIISIFILDDIDSRLYKILIDNNPLYKNKEYQVRDKQVDLFTYYIAFILFYNYFDNKNRILIIILLVWRTIGVIKFTNTLDKKYLKIFFDGINGIIILYYLSSKSLYIKNNYNYFIPITLILKFLFELYHHRQKF